MSLHASPEFIEVAAIVLRLRDIVLDAAEYPFSDLDSLRLHVRAVLLCPDDAFMMICEAVDGVMIAMLEHGDIAFTDEDGNSIEPEVTL